MDANYSGYRQRRRPIPVTDNYGHDGLVRAVDPTRLTSNQDIGLSSLFLMAPLLLLSAALVTLILIYKLDSSTLLPTESNKIYPDAIYVQVNSTLLIFLSSWMSTLVPLLTTCAIALATYPIAQQLLQDSNDEKHNRLLTAFQLSIAISFVNGSTWGSLWNLLRYNARRDKPTIRHGAALVSITITTLAAVVLGMALLAADTWLHIATKSVNVVHVPFSSSDDPFYSLSTEPQCMSTNNSFAALQADNLTCVVSTQLVWPAMSDSLTALQTLNNLSDTFTVGIHPYIKDTRYLGVVSRGLDTPSDYFATTYAISTTCKPISTECNLTLNGNPTFDCNNGAFWGEGQTLGLVGAYHQSYRYYNMSDYADIDSNYGFNNPFFTAGASMSQLSSVISSDQTHDPELVTYDRTVVAAVLFCNTTVYDAEYTVKQGKITHFATNPSNISITNMFASAPATTVFGNENLLMALKLAADAGTTAQDLADAFGNSISTIALAAATSSIRLVKGGEVTMLLVSQVPKAPLFLLMALNFCFIILGVILTILASFTSDEARAVQFRLSIAGIVANLFEGRHARHQAGTVEQLFGEYHDSEEDMRIKVQRTSTGGFIFKSVDEITEMRDEGVEDVAGWDRITPRGRKFGSFFTSPGSGGSQGLLVEDKPVVQINSREAWI